MSLPNVISEINTIKSTYLLKSGGRAETLYQQTIYNNGTDAVRITGGTDIVPSTGAMLTLFHKDTADRNGFFRLFSTNGTQTSTLEGRPNGTLTWGGKNVITSAGGTMTGNLVFNGSANTGLRCANNTSRLSMLSSNTWDSSCIHLWGCANEGNYPGCVEIIPRIGTDTYTVWRFTPEGELQKGTDTLYYVVKTWSSGASWYKKYSNGWIEQGGSIPSGGASSWRTLTFPTAFSNTKYSIVVSCSNVSDITYWAASYTKTVSSVKVGTCNYIGTKSFYGVDWYACGY